MGNVTHKVEKRHTAGPFAVVQDWFLALDGWHSSGFRVIGPKSPTETWNKYFPDAGAAGFAEAKAFAVELHRQYKAL